MTETKNNNRIQYIDALKGFAIILVVLGHVCNGYVFSMVNNRAIWMSRNIYNAIYTFHMPLFMVISGYVFVKAYLTQIGDDSVSRMKVNWNKLIRHAANLLVVYVIFSLIHGTIKIFYDDIVTVRIQPKDLLMIWKTPIAPYWYLYILIVFYFVFGTLNHFRIHPLIYTLLFIPINLMAVKLSYFDDFELRRICYYGVFFSIGTIVSIYGKKNQDEVNSNRKTIISKVIYILSVAALICGIILVIRKWSDFEYLYQMPYYNALIASLLTPSVFVLFRIIGFDYKYSFLRYLGKQSMEVYVMHIIFTAMVRYMLAAARVENVVVCLVTGTVFGVLLPLATCKLMEIILLKRFMFRPFDSVSMKKSKVYE